MVDDRELAHLEAKLENNERWTLGLTVLFTVMTALTIGIGAYYYNRYTEPETLVNLAQEEIANNREQIKAEIREEFKRNAPEFAASVSKNLRTSIPQARQELEQVLVMQLERGLDQATELSEDQFRQFLNNNRETITDLFEQLEETPEETKQYVVQLEKALEEDLGVSIQEQAKQLVAFFSELETELTKLAEDRALKPAELLELRVVRILKALQLKTIGELEEVDEKLINAVEEQVPDVSPGSS